MRGVGARRRLLHPLDDRRRAHAGADAERHERRRLVRSLELVEDGAEDHGAGGAERMAHGDGAAVHVDDLRVQVEGLRVAQHDRGEGFVDLEQVDVVDAHAGALQHLLGHVDRAVSMMAGSDPILAKARILARGFRPAALPASFEPIRTAAAPSTMPEELPAWCTWLTPSSSG